MTKIRKATLKDFKEIYKLGLKTSELKVNFNEPFTDAEDFKQRITDKNHVFLLAEIDNKIVGFICANNRDIDRPLNHRWSCIVYIAVDEKYRQQNIGTELYNECIKQLKKRKITHVYTWADFETKAIQLFLKKHKFKAGSPCIWMDRKI